MKPLKKRFSIIPHPIPKESEYLPSLSPIYQQIKTKITPKQRPSPSLMNLNRKLFNKDSIAWFNHKYSKTQIITSINNLIITPRQSTFSVAQGSHTFKPPKPIKTGPINLKYLYTNDQYKKILKLKDLFLDYDFDKNKTMEVDEIQTMFSMNNITVSKSDLINLFFKDSKSRMGKKSKKKLVMSFYQFINFCLSQDNEFRQFMKKLKDESKDGNDFLPLNFNALLNYFIDKGEERKCLKKINQTLDKMEKAIETEGYLITDMTKLKQQNEEISFEGVMKEFDCLFALTKNRGEVSKRKFRVRSPSKEQRKKPSTYLKRPSFENFNETISDWKREIEFGIFGSPLKRTDLHSLSNNKQKCFSTKNVLMY